MRKESGLSQKVIRSVSMRTSEREESDRHQQPAKTDARSVKRDDFAVCREAPKSD